MDGDPNYTPETAKEARTNISKARLITAKLGTQSGHGTLDPEVIEKIMGRIARRHSDRADIGRNQGVSGSQLSQMVFGVVGTNARGGGGK